MISNRLYAIVGLLTLLAPCPALKLDPPSPRRAMRTYSTLLTAGDLAKVKAHAGLYRDKQAHGEFSNKVLVTASNDAYAEVLQNWRCHADRLGLDYVVIALDSKIAGKLEPDRTILVNGTFVEDESTFRRPNFNLLAANKIKMVQEILLETRFGVVFSDPDNVFIEDPFAHGDDLGDKIRSGKYQYIYQQNNGDRPGKEAIGKEVNEANTGFYFVSGSQKSQGVQRLFLGALKECDDNKNIDDQTNFWRTLGNVRAGQGPASYGEGSFACTNLCGQGQPSSCNASSEHVLDYCEMDPFAHATGWHDVMPHEEGLRTFHANFIYGMAGKIEKLKSMELWGCPGNSPTPSMVSNSPAILPPKAHEEARKARN